MNSWRLGASGGVVYKSASESRKGPTSDVFLICHPLGKLHLITQIITAILFLKNKTMIEPVDEKLARSDHHSRQGLRKPGDRAKKFNNKNTPRPKQLQNSSSGTGSVNRTHGKRVDFVAVDSPSPTIKARSPSGGMMGKGGMNEFGAEMGDDEEYVSQDEDEYEEEQRQRAIMVMEGAESGTGILTRGIDGIVLDETREAATTIPIEELLASAYANKKSKKSKGVTIPYYRQKSSH